MEQAPFYREQSAKARRLAAEMIDHPDVAKTLGEFAQEYAEIAEDIESGGIEIRHKELLPQYRHKRTPKGGA